MRKTKKLSFNKQVIAQLDQSESSNIRGGGYTAGCTDGCTGSDFMCTAWNCTDNNCTNNCDTEQICSAYTCTADRICGY